MTLFIFGMSASAFLHNSIEAATAFFLAGVLCWLMEAGNGEPA